MDNLIIGGGGTLAYVLAGAASVVLKKYPTISGFGGSSAGAIITSLFAVGYSIEEVKSIMVGIDIKKCFDLNIAGLLFGGEGGNGLATGENILQELKKVLPQKMKELPENFFIVVNNCDTRKVEYITPKSHPDEDLALVVRASMSIPILFKPEKIGSYFYCDGGTRDNNPFDYFAIKAPQLKSIGVKLNNSFIGSQRKPYDSLWNMALYTIESMMDSLNIEHQADAITTEIVEITNNENGVNFDLTTQDIYRLWDDGAAQAEKYFK